MTGARCVQRIAGWIIVAISFVHLGVTFVDYDQPSLRALWFAGSGFSLLLIGGLNVITAGLTDDEARGLKGLRVLTLVSDSCGVVLGTGFIVLTGGSQPQGPILVALFLVAGTSQLRRGPR